MMTTDWVVTLLVGTGILLTLGMTTVYLYVTRFSCGPSTVVRCPMTKQMTVVQHIAQDDSYLTDVVTCSAFPRGQAITCGLPCLTGGVSTRISSRSEELVDV